jgi:BirA family transcriptional regulator, biotin operon repressor / biotin---[acetyl-CoA-carboxylase] ligase
MNPLTFQTLRLLADGNFCSGEEMARVLGVSRGTIWNALRGIEDAGVTVFKVRGRGYRVAEPLSLLDASRISVLLGPTAGVLTVEVLDRVDSTNLLLLERAAAGACSGSVIAAEWQTAGRGRRDRTWLSPLGSALTFSLLWRFHHGAAFLAGLSLAVGVALIRALAGFGVKDAAVKWPNDVLWRGRKLAGILIEMHGDTLGPSAAVIGVGLNWRLPEAVRESIDRPAGDLAMACEGPLPERNAVLAAVLRELARVLAAFSEGGFAPFRPEWEQHHADQLKPVSLTLPDGAVARGIAAGVAEDGALLLDGAAGRQRFYAGEVALARAT